MVPEGGICAIQSIMNFFCDMLDFLIFWFYVDLAFLFEVKVMFLYNVLQLFRADSLLYLLVYAQRPLLTTKTIELVCSCLTDCLRLNVPDSLLKFLFRWDTISLVLVRMPLLLS
jgi:hypothetical protein